MVFDELIDVQSWKTGHINDYLYSSYSRFFLIISLIGYESHKLTY